MPMNSPSSASCRNDRVLGRMFYALLSGLAHWQHCQFGTLVLEDSFLTCRYELACCAVLSNWHSFGDLQC